MIRDHIPVGKPRSGLGTADYKMDASNAEPILRIKSRELEEVVVDAAENLLQLRNPLMRKDELVMVSVKSSRGARPLCKPFM
jgi:hypothetical protein